MTKFSNKFKNPVFGLFSPFLGQKNFSWKIQLCHIHLHMGFQHRAKIQKKLMIQFKENAWTDGRTEGQTDPILQDPSSYRHGSKKHFAWLLLESRLGLLLFTTIFTLYILGTKGHGQLKVWSLFLFVSLLRCTMP